MLKLGLDYVLSSYAENMMIALIKAHLGDWKLLDLWPRVVRCACSVINC